MFKGIKNQDVEIKDYRDILLKRIYDPSERETDKVAIFIKRNNNEYDTFVLSDSYTLINTKKYIEDLHLPLSYDPVYYNGFMICNVHTDISIDETLKKEITETILVIKRLLDEPIEEKDVNIFTDLNIINSFNGWKKFNLSYALTIETIHSNSGKEFMNMRSLYNMLIKSSHIHSMSRLSDDFEQQKVSNRYFEVNKILKEKSFDIFAKMIDDSIPKKIMSQALAIISDVKDKTSLSLIIILYLLINGSGNLERELLLDSLVNKFIDKYLK
jgi:predicted RNase H-related nuclease YkuK (DUF458 family)